MLYCFQRITNIAELKIGGTLKTGFKYKNQYGQFCSLHNEQ